jgi:hypothetical protein
MTKVKHTESQEAASGGKSSGELDRARARISYNDFSTYSRGRTQSANLSIEVGDFDRKTRRGLQASLHRLPEVKYTKRDHGGECIRAVVRGDIARADERLCALLTEFEFDHACAVLPMSEVGIYDQLIELADDVDRQYSPRTTKLDKRAKRQEKRQFDRFCVRQAECPHYPRPEKVANRLLELQRERLVNHPKRWLESRRRARQHAMRQPKPAPMTMQVLDDQSEYSMVPALA